MNESELLNKILVGTYTMTDALRRIRALRQFIINQLFASRISEFGATDSADAAWLSGLGAEVYKEFTAQNVYARLDKIEALLKQIHPLIFYLPFEIPQGEVVRIGTRMRQEFGPNFLVEFRLDPNLIAGCALVWKNVYNDYSIRQRIEEKKEEVLSSIRDYLAEIGIK